MLQSKYRPQVDLLLSILPHVAKEGVLALKGGTAINLFVRNMPRLSVDIDLTYLPWADGREPALKNISDSLDRIEPRLKAAIHGISLTRIPAGQGQDTKLNCQFHQAHVKIEINTITRGVLFPPRLMQVASAVQDEFKKFAAINVVANAELFGGKICAALDRQHPRDLFDVHLMLNNEGLSYEIKLGVIMFMLSHYRPLSELMDPHLVDQRAAFDNQFAGMAITSFSYEDFEETRRELLLQIRKAFNANDRKLLLSFEEGAPLWDLFPHQNLRNLPAVRWKQENIQALRSKNPEKHRRQVRILEEALSW